MLPNFDELKKEGVEVRKFCGWTVEVVEGAYNLCHNEAVGEIMVPFTETDSVPVPLCEQHLEEVMSEFGKKVEKLDMGDAHLLE